MLQLRSGSDPSLQEVWKHLHLATCHEALRTEDVVLLIDAAHAVRIGSTNSGAVLESSPRRNQSAAAQAAAGTGMLLDPGCGSARDPATVRDAEHVAAPELEGAVVLATALVAQKAHLLRGCQKEDIGNVIVAVSTAGTIGEKTLLMLAPRCGIAVESAVAALRLEIAA